MIHTLTADIEVDIILGLVFITMKYSNIHVHQNKKLNSCTIIDIDTK